jgi:hypothetical protein
MGGGVMWLVHGAEDTYVSVEDLNWKTLKESDHFQYQV